MCVNIKQTEPQLQCTSDAPRWPGVRFHAFHQPRERTPRAEPQQSPQTQWHQPLPPPAAWSRSSCRSPWGGRHCPRAQLCRFQHTFCSLTCEIRGASPSPHGKSHLQVIRTNSYTLHLLSSMGTCRFSIGWDWAALPCPLPWTLQASSTTWGATSSQEIPILWAPSRLFLGTRKPQNTDWLLLDDWHQPKPTATSDFFFLIIFMPWGKHIKCIRTTGLEEETTEAPALKVMANSRTRSGIQHLPCSTSAMGKEPAGNSAACPTPKLISSIIWKAH